MLQKATPAGTHDGIFGADFVENDLRPRTAARTDLQVALDIDQSGDDIPSFLLTLFDFTGRTRRELEVKLAQLRARSVGYLVWRQREKELIERKKEACGGIFSEFAEQVFDKRGRKRFGRGLKADGNSIQQRVEHAI